eukprot:8135776-Prorocentrum_lima.AAC.1
MAFLLLLHIVLQLLPWCLWILNNELLKYRAHGCAAWLESVRMRHWMVLTRWEQQLNLLLLKR